MSETNNAARVKNMYESNEVKAGEIISDGWLHYGYFDALNQDASLGEGSARFTEIMIDKTPIEAGQLFCDIGCGIGTPAIMLAEARGCFVDGITISKHQRDVAESRSIAAGLSDKVKFYEEDALKMPFDDKSYDGGWFFESISHMGHRKALMEAHRVLKPGAILLLADYITTDATTEDFLEFSRNEVHSFFISLEEYHAVLKETGFELIDLVDVSKEVSDPFPGKFEEAFNAHKDEIRDLVDDKSISRWLDVHQRISDNIGYITAVGKRI